jgi:hypothetical protein
MAAHTDVVFVWDIDGTMISDNEEGDCRVRVRPHLEAALRYTFENCRYVGVWTAASSDWYGVVYRKVLKPILQRLGKSFAFVWFGDRCSNVARKYNDDGFTSSYSPMLKQKPLAKLWRPRLNRQRWGVSRHNVLIADDTPFTYAKNWGNALPVTTYDADHPDSKNDRTLLELTERLDSLLQQYCKRNQHVFVNLGFTQTIVDTIHQYAPVRSVRGLVVSTS